MVPFLYVVHELLVNLAAARNSENNSDVRDVIVRAALASSSIPFPQPSPTLSERQI